MFDFALQGFDADWYLEAGKQLAESGALLRWCPLRPFGAALYVSIPFRLGLPPEFLIVMNYALMALSILLAGLAMNALFHTDQRRWPFVGWLVAIPPHLVFITGVARTALMDAPAACLALSGIWLLILGFTGKKFWMYALAGFAFGLAVILRAFYLYPVIIIAVLFVAMLFVRNLHHYRSFKAYRREVLGGMLFVLLAATPILFQFSLTHHFTGTWSFIDNTKIQYWSNVHLTSTWAGYDTLVPAGGLPYDASACFKKPGGGL